jgi:hypothetical protein
MAGMRSRILRVSEDDAVPDLAATLKRAQASTEIVIERDVQPLAVIRAAAPERRTGAPKMLVQSQADYLNGLRICMPSILCPSCKSSV